MDSKIYNISNIRTKKLNGKMLDFIQYLAKTNNTVATEISERFNITKKARYDRMKKIENLGILKGVQYIWDYKSLGYLKESYLFVKGLDNKKLMDTGIIMEIEQFNNEDISFIKARIYDESQEKDLEEALRDKKILFRIDKLL